MPYPGVDQAARERGFALIAVLWLLLVLSVIAAGTLRNTRTETNLVRNGLETSRAGALADAAVQRAILSLMTSGLEPGWPRDGTPVIWNFGGSDIQVSIQDEAGKIDLNLAPPRLLKGLFLAVGVEETPAAALADAVVDYRDPNNLRRLNGAEDEDYRQAGYPLGAKDAPFVRTAELRQVFGMPLEVFQKIAPVVTVYSDHAAIDPQTASRLALRAVPDNDPAAVDNFVAKRAQDSGDRSPIDRTLRPSLGSSDFYSDAGAGRVYSVHAEVRRVSGARFIRRAIVRLSSLAGSPFKLEQWEQR